MNNWTNIFIYGSLKPFTDRAKILATAERNGHAKYLYMAQTKSFYDLLDFGTFPGLIYGNYSIGGEVYSVSFETLEMLDKSENHPKIFTRQEILLRPDEYAADYKTSTTDIAQAYYFNFDSDGELLYNAIRPNNATKSYVKNLTKTLKIWNGDYEI